jgi:UDP-N-acetylglucosamine:LPS N-acetylglucosamine transferase
VLKRKRVFIIAGQGGHLEQAKRFIQLPTTIESDLVLISDCDPHFALHKELAELEVVKVNNISEISKRTGLMNKLVLVYSLFKLILISVILFFKYRPSGIITFGPLICVPFLFWSKIFKIKSVHIETWSKFYEPTKCGLFASRFAQKIYVQNETLMKALNESEYSGKL